MAVPARFLLLAALAGLGTSVSAQDIASVSRQCLAYGFKEKTAAHDQCIKQLLRPTGGLTPVVPSGPIKPSGPKAPTQPESQKEDIFWAGAKALDTVEAFEAYLGTYLKGRYTDLARTNVNRLAAAEKAQQQANLEEAQKLAAAIAEAEAAQNAAVERAVAEEAKSIAVALAAKVAQQKAEADAVRQREMERAAIEAARKVAAERAIADEVKALATARASAAAAAALRELAVRTPGRVIRDCADCPEMVVVPAGTFIMGSDALSDEQPVRRVNVSSFLMGKTEVTQAQWQAVMGNNPSIFRRCGDDCPVEQISWYEAQEFAQRLSHKTGKQYRLPSEAEWEYAARAGSGGSWSFGDSDATVGEFSWFRSNSQSRTQKVAQKKPNDFGLFDVHGNVSEWVADCFHLDYVGAPSDGRPRVTDCGNDVQMVRRGGTATSSPLSLRSADRNRNKPEARSGLIGLRIALTLFSP